MYSGHLLLMTSLFEILFDDGEFVEKGSLVLVGIRCFGDWDLRGLSMIIEVCRVLLWMRWRGMGGLVFVVSRI